MQRFFSPISRDGQAYQRIRFNLNMKMIAAISILIVGILIIFSLFLHHFVSTMIEDQVGKRALGLAKTVAEIPALQQAFQSDNPSASIQELVEPIRKETGAQFIVVGNKDGIRYSHPYKNRIGKRMVGGDNERALKEGQSYITKNVGSLGLSIRGKTPVFDENHHIIGVVSVGFLNQNIKTIIKNQSKLLWLTLIGIAFLGILGAGLIARYLKKLLSGMEPEEISHLLKQKEAILQSAHEGIIAVDEQRRITVLNTAANDMLHLPRGKRQVLLGKQLEDVLPYTKLFNPITSAVNQEMVIGQNVVLVTQVPITEDNAIVGGVATLRKKQEVEEITKELHQVKQYANAQRAQTHEFSNKLSIMLGLLQLKQYDEAIAFIKKEQNIRREWSRFLLENVKDPLVSGLLQAKMNEMRELGISLKVHPQSQLNEISHTKQQRVLISGIGNLLDNAMEAVKQMPEDRKKEIEIFFTDIGDDILIEVTDSGPGIKEDDMERIFQQGFSTKPGENRGTGLALVRHLLHEAGGEIMVEDSELGGACFVMTMPKDLLENNG